MTLNPWRLKLLDVFERVGTVRAVAAELHLSPSTVSQQLGVLESETGVQLFERSGRSLVLTSAGTVLAERARDLGDRMDAIEAELTEIGSGPAGRIIVGGFSSSVAPLLIPLVGEIHRTHPGLTIELRETEPREATTLLLQGKCDIIVTVDEGDGTLLSSSLTVAPLAADPLLLVAPHGHAVGNASTVSLANLAEENWALDVVGTYLGELVPRECRLAGFEPRVAGHFSSYSALLSHVAAGLSVGILPLLAIDTRPGLITRPVAGLADRKIVTAVRTGNARRRSIIAVADALRVVAASTPLTR